MEVAPAEGSEAHDPRPPGGLHAALSFFTVLPVRPFEHVDRDVARRAIAWFPVAGLVLATGATAIAVVLGAVTQSTLLGSVVLVLCLAGLTGGLHLDGVADTADGLGSRAPADRALTIMRQSDIGPMGVLAIIAVLTLDITALASLPGSGWLIMAGLSGPLVARSELWWATTPGVPPARAEGFGALFVGVTQRARAVWLTLALLTVLAALTWVVMWWSQQSGVELALVTVLGVVGSAALALAIGSLWRRHLVRRLGGVSGDVFGSLIEVTQSTFWVLLAVTAGLIAHTGL